MRSSFTDKDKVLVACKAGYNDDPHHGHLDCGQFIVYWRGEGFIDEMPRYTYDKRYFEERRWEVPQANSTGHNVIMVNGETQIPAKLKNQPWLEGIGGDITKWETTENRDYALLEPTGAYPQNELAQWNRHITLEKEADITVVLDDVTAETENAEIVSRFFSEAGKVNQVIKDGYLLLDGRSGDMALIPLVIGGDYRFREGLHTVKPELKNADEQNIPYMDIVVNAPAGHAFIGAAILPVENEEEAESILQSSSITDDDGSITVSTEKAGEVYTFKF
jgi:hypothetical protein